MEMVGQVSGQSTSANNKSSQSMVPTTPETDRTRDKMVYFRPASQKLSADTFLSGVFTAMTEISILGAHKKVSNLLSGAPNAP